MVKSSRSTVIKGQLTNLNLQCTIRELQVWLSAASLECRSNTWNLLQIFPLKSLPPSWLCVSVCSSAVSLTVFVEWNNVFVFKGHADRRTRRTPRPSCESPDPVKRSTIINMLVFSEFINLICWLCSFSFRVFQVPQVFKDLQALLEILVTGWVWNYISQSPTQCCLIQVMVQGLTRLRAGEENDLKLLWKNQSMRLK